jgi:hypothetical protein
MPRSSLVNLRNPNIGSRKNISDYKKMSDGGER